MSGLGFNSKSFISTESVDNQETLNLTDAKQAKRVIIVDANDKQIAIGSNLPAWDFLARVLTNATTETYTFKSGGSGGTTVATIVIVYTDSTLGTLLNVTKT